MSTKTFFDYDALTNTTEYFHQEADGSFAIEAVQDVTEIVEANKRVQNLDTGRWRDFTEVANIPLTKWLELQQSGIMDLKGKIRDQKAMKRWLNDPENLYFRTRLGRV